jgi:guanylate kinase
MKKGKFIVISGPSGVGKGTICNRLLNELNAWYSVSTTTRAPRDGEINGVNYFFVTKEEFENKIKEGEFLEYNIYNGNYYGTSKEIAVDKINEGINVFSEIDVNGAHNIKKVFPDALLIYIAPPSIEVLKERLISRGTESIEKINQRLEIAEKELKEVDFYDYVVINDDLDKATDEVRNIITKEI